MKTKVTRQLRATLAAAAGLLLAGCSATHVGESWQCPLAQGSSCASIAEADPAVPAAARPAVLFGEPLLGAYGRADGAARPGRRVEGETCDSECGLLAWLTRQFRVDHVDAAASPRSEAPTAGQDGDVPSAAPGTVVADDASLRVPEVLGRIWIAPFVDADGIYREAHWVRVVLEPAGWKLP